ncbi:hypothetical protein LWC34_00230 [Kibdelosporangium philippinense]|uniref:Uncharacterized protein n=2 Tax=Kibdelosporangium philippinense TaxID=211113 RepID=A0ABS8Z0L1_9PSEU|nr:hypothetical protein [Kibdelosporangium philippinense]MCE7001275.1 hypothetical protein [Kibdelosporangium philippinense]
MTYTAQPPVKRPASRLTAGLLWLVAAGLGVGATFSDILVQDFGQGSGFRTGFWTQGGIQNGREVEGQMAYYGIEIVVAAAFLLLAFLLVLLTQRRWAPAIAGTFGTGMYTASALTWIVTLPSAAGEPEPQLGLWLFAGAAVVALIGLGVALAERARPMIQPPPRFMPPPPPHAYPMRPPQPPPPPPPPPRVEPATPKYGVPVQPESPLDEPERTTAIDPPPPGSISRKLDGDET